MVEEIQKMTLTPVLVTGATGYVGGRLIPRLLQAGLAVRAMARSLDKLSGRPWASDPNVELVRGDVLDRDALYRAAAGCDAAYYLVHGMIAGKSGFAAADRQSALNMAAVAEKAGLKQIIYLGGLGDPADPRLSPHLASRHEVGRILRAGSVPATVLRAAMILGSGSASFEILRYLVERLPWMITPKWVQTPTQPIAISNVLGYLIGCLRDSRTYGQTFDIGGPEIITYEELIHLFAEEADLPQRRVVPVPLLTPRLSAHWIQLVTPVPAAIALPLTEGLGIPTCCTDHRIRELIPQDLLACREAIRRALQRLRDDQVETSWRDAGALRPPEWALSGDASYSGGTILNCAYRMTMEVSPEVVWKLVLGLGGAHGYYFGNWLWRLRGWIDRGAGGIGLERGRRSSRDVHVGEAFDFWRVLSVVPLRQLILLAEMKMPGQAVLELRMVPRGERRTELRMVSRFWPKGLGGLVYWHVLYPFHAWLFRGMLHAMAKQAGARPVGRPMRFEPRMDGEA
jgi:uncharacterized protein YbjT (DUF2867 family)